MPPTGSRRAIFAIAGWWLLALGAEDARAVDDLTLPLRGETPTGAPIQFLGTSSCASNACHNRGNTRGASSLALYEPRASWEYAYWNRYDPHAQAYAVLEDEPSKRIVMNLRGLGTLDEARPQQDGLCLSCHVHQGYSDAASGPEFAVGDGVGCEGCHGASQRWNAAHFQAGWAALGRAEKAAYGFVPLDSLADRARACTPCHVGSDHEDHEYGLVDVNHDLIAAGHPRLNFEFASYHARYPKHWEDLPERSADPAFEARAWAVGQLATAEAALRLLKARAGRVEVDETDRLPRPLRPVADRGLHAWPWPEFAEYNCYACHHDLLGGSPLDLGVASAAPGQWPWGTWYTPMTDAIARELPPAGADWPQLLGAIELEMSHPLPGPGPVTSRVDEALVVLDGWLSGLCDRPIDTGTVDRLTLAVVEHLRREEDPTWDRNAQAYLALAALHAARGDLDPSRRDPRMAEALDAMLGRLQFRGNSDGPPEYRIEGLDRLLSAILPPSASEE